MPKTLGFSMLAGFAVCWVFVSCFWGFQSRHVCCLGFSAWSLLGPNCVLLFFVFFEGFQSPVFWFVLVSAVRCWFWLVSAQLFLLCLFSVCESKFR